MKLDRDRPYGEIIGQGGPKGAKFYQGPKYFDLNGDELSAKKEPVKKVTAKESGGVSASVEASATLS